MQLAGWVGYGPISWLHLPGWTGTWFSLFNDWPTFLGQFSALVIVIGSSVGAQYLRVWRPRRRGQQPSRGADQLPDRPADIAVATPLTGPPATA